MLCNECSALCCQAPAARVKPAATLQITNFQKIVSMVLDQSKNWYQLWHQIFLHIQASELPSV